jgi:hypothetical protein
VWLTETDDIDKQAMAVFLQGWRPIVSPGQKIFTAITTVIGIYAKFYIRNLTLNHQIY